MPTSPVFADAVTVGNYALTMDELEMRRVQAGLQIVRGGGVGGHLMPGERSMACDVDSAGARFGPSR